jgi:hypothetical protein
MNLRVRGPFAHAFLSNPSRGGRVTAQTGDKYTVRLGMVPAANGNQTALVTGKGAATATLAGNKLTINGTFEGLPAPPPLRRLHQGVAKGARGKAFADLTITKAASGTISGTVTLHAGSGRSLEAGKDLHAGAQRERHRTGAGKVDPNVDNSNLWGWLLK